MVAELTLILTPSLQSLGRMIGVQTQQTGVFLIIWSKANGSNCVCTHMHAAVIISYQEGYLLIVIFLVSFDMPIVAILISIDCSDLEFYSIVH